ncbi:AraC family transcriptional regulator [Plasticicumulans sp.]|uniref:AraC family transcriptional regulator n=1 Tax=Plasticicumulans sp. TaxID=2307179 RepID=UPI000FACB054|nr:MAG: AraC family transcriptional regulator [Xanthomonadales bacterium]
MSNSGHLAPALTPRPADAPERSVPALERLPRAVYARAESLPAGSWVRPHRHDWVQLSWALSGVLEVRTDTGCWLAPPQRAVWIPPGTLHEVNASARAEMRSLYLDASRTAWAPLRCRVLAVSPLVRELILALSARPLEYDPDGPAGRLAEVLLDAIAELPELDFGLPLPADARLRRLCEALQAEPADARTLPEWAARCGLSERTLTRRFRRETGLSFADWRRRLRLLLALGALEAGRSVTAVALDSGYDSLSAFIAAFRNEFGTTPKALFAPAPVNDG